MSCLGSATLSFLSLAPPAFMWPFVSERFWSKVTQVHDLRQLYAFVPPQSISVPDEVLRCDTAPLLCRRPNCTHIPWHGSQLFHSPLAVGEIFRETEAPMLLWCRLNSPPNDCPPSLSPCTQKHYSHPSWAGTHQQILSKRVSHLFRCGSQCKRSHTSSHTGSQSLPTPTR